MKIKGITRPVVVLGLVSLFTDLASEMLYPIIPLFITGTLGLSTSALGVIEGIAEGISTGLRWIGGVLSDLANKRKPFVFWGYTLSAFAKPIMGLAAVAGGAGTFLAGRSVDRVGKSIRTAARDALIADATDKEHRGVAFGFHRAMDTTGAVLGPLMALAILWLRPETPLHWLFFVALAPGLISALLVAFFLKDRPHTADPAAAKAKTRFWQHYPRAFWLLIAANLLFSLGNSSDSFLILRSVQMHFGVEKMATSATALSQHAVFATILFALYNLFYAVIAAPAGALSDKIARKKVVAIGWVVYAGVYAGFAFGNASWLPWVLFASYGLYQAFAEGVTKAMVSDLVPSDRRAGAIGLYYTVSGVGQLAASVAVGVLYDRFGAMALATGVALPLLAVPVLLAVSAERQSSE